MQKQEARPQPGAPDSHSPHRQRMSCPHHRHEQPGRCMPSTQPQLSPALSLNTGGPV